MYKTAAEIISLLGSTIAADTSLQAYCQGNFSKALTVYQGIDTENPPGKDDCPFAVIYGISQHGEGESKNRIIYNCDVSIFILDSTINTTTTNLKKYMGLVKVEEVRHLVENAIFGLKLGKVDVGGETEVFCFFPIFRSDTLVSIDFLRSSREPRRP